MSPSNVACKPGLSRLQCCELGGLQGWYQHPAAGAAQMVSDPLFFLPTDFEIWQNIATLYSSELTGGFLSNFWILLGGSIWGHEYVVVYKTETFSIVFCYKGWVIEACRSNGLRGNKLKRIEKKWNINVWNWVETCWNNSSLICRQFNLWFSTTSWIHWRTRDTDGQGCWPTLMQISPWLTMKSTSGMLAKLGIAGLAWHKKYQACCSSHVQIVGGFRCNKVSWIVFTLVSVASDISGSLSKPNTKFSGIPNQTGEGLMVIVHIIPYPNVSCFNSDFPEVRVSPGWRHCIEQLRASMNRSSRCCWIEARLVVARQVLHTLDRRVINQLQVEL